MNYHLIVKIIFPIKDCEGGQHCVGIHFYPYHHCEASLFIWRIDFSTHSLGPDWLAPAPFRPPCTFSRRSGPHWLSTLTLNPNTSWQVCIINFLRSKGEVCCLKVFRRRRSCLSLHFFSKSKSFCAARRCSSFAHTAAFAFDFFNQFNMIIFYKVWVLQRFACSCAVLCTFNRRGWRHREVKCKQTRSENTPGWNNRLFSLVRKQRTSLSLYFDWLSLG